MDNNSLAHTTWNCKYHIVFAPKYRRQIIYGKIKAEVGKILRTLCERKGVEILEAEACPNHIHMLVSIPQAAVETRAAWNEPYPYAGKHTAEVQCIRVYGIPEREKFADDIRQVCEHEVPIWESTVLVQRVLCEYGRTQ